MKKIANQLNNINSDSPHDASNIALNRDIMFGGNVLLKKCNDQCLPLITAIVNKSMTESVTPSSLKRATIMPSLKRSTLEEKDVKRYRRSFYF